MPLTSKILGQSAPSAAVNTTIYTVPSSTNTGCTIKCVNTSSAATETISVALVPNGQTLSTERYIIRNLILAKNESLEYSGIELNAGDFIIVNAFNGTASFTVTGIETT